MRDELGGRVDPGTNCRRVRRLAARPYDLAPGRSAVFRLALARVALRSDALRATALAVGPTGRHHAVIGGLPLRR